MFMFGLVTVCQGLVHSWGGLLTTRFFLGLFEAGMVSRIDGKVSFISCSSTYSSLVVSTFFRCGILELKRKNDLPSSSPVPLWLVLLVVYLLQLSESLTMLEATELGYVPFLHRLNSRLTRIQRWVFIIEGCVTCAFALAWWFAIPGEMVILILESSSNSHRRFSREG